LTVCYINQLRKDVQNAMTELPMAGPCSQISVGLVVKQSIVGHVIGHEYAWSVVDGNTRLSYIQLIELGKVGTLSRKDLIAEISVRMDRMLRGHREDLG
jgi:hypothetical protein